MSRVYCESCQSMVRSDDVHSCFDAAKLAQIKDAERTVIAAAKAFESLIHDHGYQSGGPVTINSSDSRLLMDTISQLVDTVNTLRAQEGE